MRRIRGPCCASFGGSYDTDQTMRNDLSGGYPDCQSSDAGLYRICSVPCQPPLYHTLSGGSAEKTSLPPDCDGRCLCPGKARNRSRTSQLRYSGCRSAPWRGGRPLSGASACSDRPSDSSGFSVSMAQRIWMPPGNARRIGFSWTLEPAAENALTGISSGHFPALIFSPGA